MEVTVLRTCNSIRSEEGGGEVLTPLLHALESMPLVGRLNTG